MLLLTLTIEIAVLGVRLRHSTVVPDSTMMQLGVNDEAARMRMTLLAGSSEDGCAGGGVVRWESQVATRPSASGSARWIPSLGFMELLDRQRG